MSRTNIFFGHDMNPDIIDEVEFDQKKFSELEVSELNILYRVSMQYRSHMKNLVKWFKSNDLPYDVLAVRAHLDGNLVGWGYIELNHSAESFETGVYIQRNYRGKGIGTEIISRIKCYDETIDLIAKPWDYKGKCFFNKNGIYFPIGRQ